MGVTLNFRTAAPVPAEVGGAIRAEHAHAGTGRHWVHCEPISLHPDAGDGRLVGSSKLNLHPRPDEAAGATRDPAAVTDLEALLDQLADWSDRFRLTWVLDVEGHKLGGIENGTIDPRLMESLGALSAVADELTRFDPPAPPPPGEAALFADPDDRDEPPSDEFQPRLFGG